MDFSLLLPPSCSAHTPNNYCILSFQPHLPLSISHRQYPCSDPWLNICLIFLKHISGHVQVKIFLWNMLKCKHLGLHRRGLQHPILHACVPISYHPSTCSCPHIPCTLTPGIYMWLVTHSNLLSYFPFLGNLTGPLCPSMTSYAYYFCHGCHTGV